MSQDAVNRLGEDIDDRIDYYRQEYEMTYAEIIGLLEMCKLDMYMEALESEE